MRRTIAVMLVLVLSWSGAVQANPSPLLKELARAAGEYARGEVIIAGPVKLTKELTAALCAHLDYLMANADCRNRWQYLRDVMAAYKLYRYPAFADRWLEAKYWVERYGGDAARSVHIVKWIAKDQTARLLTYLGVRWAKGRLVSNAAWQVIEGVIIVGGILALLTYCDMRVRLWLTEKFGK